MRILPISIPRLVLSVRGLNSSALLRADAPHSPYHALLNLDEGSNQFNVNQPQLKQNFLQAQRLAHPDLVAARGVVCLMLVPFSSVF